MQMFSRPYAYCWDEIYWSARLTFYIYCWKSVYVSCFLRLAPAKIDFSSNVWLLFFAEHEGKHVALKHKRRLETRIVKDIYIRN